MFCLLWMIIPEEAQCQSKFKLIPWYENGLWGYANPNREVVIPPQFTAADFFTPGGIAQVTLPAKPGSPARVAMVDVNGKIFLPEVPSKHLFAYDRKYISYIADTIRKPGTFSHGLLDANGKMITPPNQTYCRGCMKLAPGVEPDYLIVQHDYDAFRPQRTAIIEPGGKHLTGFDYFQVFYYGDDCFLFQRLPEDPWGMMDHAGKVIAEPQWINVDPPLGKYLDYEKFDFKLIPVQHKNKAWGFVDRTGKTVVDFQFLKVSHFNSGEAVVSQQKALPDRTDTVYYRINKNGVQTSVLLPAETLASGWDLYTKNGNGKVGIANRNGDWVVPPEYRYAYPGSYGIYVTQKNVTIKYGAFRNSGELMYPPEYDDIQIAENGMVYLYNGKARAIGDTLGNIRIPFTEVPFPQFSLMGMTANCIWYQPAPDQFEIMRLDGTPSPVAEAFPDAFILDYETVAGKAYLLLSRSASEKDILGWVDEDANRFFK